MNVAILIGVSEYTKLQDLPACLYDTQNLSEVLAASQKYDDIKVINTGTVANKVKDKLRTFFQKHQESEIEEAFVFFSGHGASYQSDALFCCTDFDSQRPSSTSISNSELDDLLRSVSPRVAVKVIDACQSGTPYIKEAHPEFDKSFSSSKLDSFICMSSSRQNQSSFATETESFFTSKWIDAALSKESGTVFYRDIESAIADEFVHVPEQTPFFVNQGTGLETFADVTTEMSELAASRKQAISPQKDEKSTLQLILHSVNQNDKEFVKHEAAIDAIERSKNGLTEYQVTDNIVQTFYDVTISTDEKLSSIPKRREVAEFAFEQKWPKQYFIQVIEEEYKVRVPKNPMRSIGLWGGINSLDESETVIERRKRPAYLETTEVLPFETAKIEFKPKNPSLSGYFVVVGIVHSLHDVKILSSAVKLRQKGWNSVSPELSDMQWKYETYSWNSILDKPNILWEDALHSCESVIKTYLESLITKEEENPPQELTDAS